MHLNSFNKLFQQQKKNLQSHLSNAKFACTYIYSECVLYAYAHVEFKHFLLVKVKNKTETF